MRPKYFFMVIVIFLTFCSWIYAATTLQILEPRRNQNPQKGSIEAMSVYVKPQGCYSEVIVDVTFNPIGSKWSNITDTLEIVLNFQLDSKAMISDSYLYMDDGEKVKAILIDVWTATKIYEDYVKRRTDPSILRKKDAVNYEFRIFPLAGSLSRRAQINMQIPNKIYENMDEIALPLEWLNASYSLPENINLYFVPNSEFSNPTFSPEKDSIVFTPYQDGDYGNTLKAIIPSTTAKGLKNLYVSSTLSTNNFLSVNNFENNLYYQLSIPLNTNTDEVPKQNICFVLDYEEGKANQSLNDVISALKTSLLNYTTPGDSFNVILSGFKPVAVSSKWLASDSSNITQIFANINSSSVSVVTHLYESVDKAKEFINSTGSNGIIYIISNSDSYGDYKVANEFINNFFNSSNKNISFSVYSFCNESKCRSYTIGGMTYKANDYLYLNLVRLTKGSSFYKTSNNETPISAFGKAMPEVMGAYDNFMIYTILDDGFVYNKFPFSDKLAANSRYKEFGMISGTLPMTIDIGYTFRSKFFNKKIKITQENLSTENYSTHVLWAGNMIAAKEKLTQTNNTVYQIIDESRLHRVLSLYTAFLALEKNDKDTTAGDPSNDDGEVLSVTDLTGVKLSIAPNPITSNTTINVVIPDGLLGANLSMALYDMFGREVKRFNTNEITGQEISINWDTTDNNGSELANGVYIMVLQIGNSKISMKVVIAR
ncbi:MAG: T9SS type A sorting domain-containing protein [bacterium]